MRHISQPRHPLTATKKCAHLLSPTERNSKVCFFIYLLDVSILAHFFVPVNGQAAFGGGSLTPHWPLDQNLKVCFSQTNFHYFFLPRLTSTLISILEFTLGIYFFLGRFVMGKLRLFTLLQKCVRIALIAHSFC